MAADVDTEPDTAKMLKILRYYAGCGDSQTRFAATYGFTVKHWNNFERGRPLSKEAALQLVRRFPGTQCATWQMVPVEDRFHKKANYPL